MLKRHYSYTVLRYLHDPATAEFVNVGVAMLCPATGHENAVMFARTRTTVGRLRDFFPVDRQVFREMMRTVNRSLLREADKVAKEGLFRSSSDALKVAQTVIPSDSSSLQWSPLIAGTTEDPQKTFESIFRRMVTKYDNKSTPRRTDEEIWKPVRQELERRNLPITFESKVIAGADDKIEFQHAWKNGSWHVYEPVSLDLAEADGIYKKAHRWLGQLTSVAPEASEQFKPYFIVGAPSDPTLRSAYERALRILKKSPVEIELFQEDQIDQLVDQIENEVRAHAV